MSQVNWEWRRMSSRRNVTFSPVEQVCLKDVRKAVNFSVTVYWFCKALSWLWIIVKVCPSIMNMNQCKSYKMSQSSASKRALEAAAHFQLIKNLNRGLSSFPDIFSCHTSNQILFQKLFFTTSNYIFLSEQLILTTTLIIDHRYPHASTLPTLS